MARRSPRNAVYIIARSFQIFFCIACLGISAVLRFAYWTSGPLPLNYSTYDYYKWRAKRDAMPEPEPRRWGGSSSSYDDYDDGPTIINPEIFLGILIAVSIFGGLTAVASLGTQCSAYRKVAGGMKFFMIWDILPIAILFIVGAGLTGTFIGQAYMWEYNWGWILPHLLKADFAIALILFFLFAYTGLHAISLRKRTGEPRDPATANTAASTAPLGSVNPPAYPATPAPAVYTQDPKMQQNYQPQPPYGGAPSATGTATTESGYTVPQQYQQPYSPPMSPPPQQQFNQTGYQGPPPPHGS